MDSRSSQLWIAGSAIAAMQQLGEERYPCETGGMLLGYEADNGEAVVTTIIGPGPAAKHRRYGFVPDAKFQQAALEECFFITNGRETYLGDWHTHPRGTCELSLLDRRTLARIAETPTSRTRHPIMAILAGVPGNWKSGAVRYLGTFLKDCRLAALTPVIFEQEESGGTGISR